MLHDNWSEHSTLQEHHVFSGPNRTNSEENGLKIYLCRDHHPFLTGNTLHYIKAGKVKQIVFARREDAEERLSEMEEKRG